MNIERRKHIRYLLTRCSLLKSSMIRTITDNSVSESGRFSSYKTYSEEYDYLAREVAKVIDLNSERILGFDTSKMKNWGDTLWPQQKQIIDSLIVYTDTLIAILSREEEFANDEYIGLENFIKNKLRACLFERPEKEKEVQNALELLFIGRGWSKGNDYDRETGKFEFSGKEYIPDFIVPKLELCIEIKLLKENRKSQIIEEINADITAYSKQYNRILFVIYDLGFIRDEVEFRRDIENSRDEVKVVLIKH